MLPTSLIAATNDIVKVDGSSTVYPITEAVAEEFQIATRIKVTVGVQEQVVDSKSFAGVKQLFQMLQGRLN